MNTAVGARQVANTFACHQRHAPTCLAPLVYVANTLAFHQRLTPTCLAPFLADQKIIVLARFMPAGWWFCQGRGGWMVGFAGFG